MSIGSVSSGATAQTVNQPGCHEVSTPEAVTQTADSCGYAAPAPKPVASTQSSAESLVAAIEKLTTPHKQASPAHAVIEKVKASNLSPDQIKKFVAAALERIPYKGLDKSTGSEILIHMSKQWNVWAKGDPGRIARPTAQNAAQFKTLKRLVNKSPTALALWNEAFNAGQPIVIGKFLGVDPAKNPGFFVRRKDYIALSPELVRNQPNWAVASVAHEAMHAKDDREMIFARVEVAAKDAGIRPELTSLIVESLGHGASAKVLKELTGKPSFLGNSMESVISYVAAHPWWSSSKGKPIKLTAAEKQFVYGTIKAIQNAMPGTNGEFAFSSKSIKPTILPSKTDPRVVAIGRRHDFDGYNDNRIRTA